jgi:uncharacterized membrane protein YdbT with pleckstrin-like domain
MSELYVANPKMFKNHPLGFILSVILIAAFGLGLLILLWWFLKTKASKLTVTDSDIHYEEGLLNKVHSEISLESVRTIKVKQSFFNRIFGVGSIEIFTAGDSPEIVVSGMPDPNKVREILKGREDGDD